MAQYDWMSDPGFRTELVEIVKRVAGQNGMEQYQTVIIDRLIGHVEENRQILVESELQKTAGVRKSKADATRSAEILIREACKYAKTDKRTLLEARDFDIAYEAKFCMVWPFCGKRK